MCGQGVRGARRQGGDDGTQPRRPPEQIRLGQGRPAQPQRVGQGRHLGGAGGVADAEEHRVRAERGGGEDGRRRGPPVPEDADGPAPGGTVEAGRGEGAEDAVHVRVLGVDDPGGGGVVAHEGVRGAQEADAVADVPGGGDDRPLQRHGDGAAEPVLPAGRGRAAVGRARGAEVLGREGEHLVLAQVSAAVVDVEAQDPVAGRVQHRGERVGDRPAQDRRAQHGAHQHTPGLEAQ